MTDFLGNGLSVGDRVAYISGHSHSAKFLSSGRVVGVTKERVRVQEDPVEEQNIPYYRTRRREKQVKSARMVKIGGN